MSHDDFDFDAAPGLPTKLPKGEILLWQGAPDWRALAVRVFHIRKLALYFMALVVWTVGHALAEGADVALLMAFWPVPAALAAIGAMVVLAWLTARNTIYTITSRRIVIRFGVALPMTINLPFAVVGSAALKELGGGTGDISIETIGSDQIAYLVLWPHVRPWKIAKVQPTLRCVPEAPRIARLLSNALAAAIGPSTAKPSTKPATAEGEQRLPTPMTA
ncbi:MAG: photosynthetic complex putative assembly protein PuhB [Elsteraceae bacterium]